MFDQIKRLFGSEPAPELSATASHQDPRECLKQWTTESLDGRRVDVFSPSGNTPPTAVVLFLHGHGRIMLNENTVFSNLFQQHGMAAVCPDGGRSWWLDVVCQDFHPEITAQNWLLQSVVPYIEQRFGVQPPRIPLLGISMGGQGVLQLAFRQASQFPVVAAISPAVDFFTLYGSGIPLDTMFPNAEAARQASVVLNLHPLAWPRHQFFCCDPQDHEWFDGAARLGMKLSSSGILHERDLDTSGGGHSWEYFDRMAPICMKHIVESLCKVEAA